MDKKIAGLLGAAAALTTMSSAQASPAQTPELAPAASYSDLLSPIANPVPMLQADNARRAESEGTQVAQISVQLGGHHHHHRRYHHHHHHHVRIIHHHHHHHHH